MSELIGVLASGVNAYYLQNEIKKQTKQLQSPELVNSIDRLNETLSGVDLSGLAGKINETSNDTKSLKSATTSLINNNSETKKVVDSIKAVTTGFDTRISSITSNIDDIKNNQLKVIKNSIEAIDTNALVQGVEGITNSVAELKVASGSIKELKPLLNDIKSKIDKVSSGNGMHQEPISVQLSVIHMVAEDNKGNYLAISFKDDDGKFLNAKVVERANDTDNVGNIWFAKEDTFQRHEILDKTAENAKGLIGPFQYFSSIDIKQYFSHKSDSSSTWIRTNQTLMIGRSFGGIRLKALTVAGTHKAMINNGGNIVFKEFDSYGDDYIPKTSQEN